MVTSLFSNRPNDGKDLTLNFFYRSASTTKTAQLACPFFTDARPISILREAGCGNIKLLVRLCEATSHVALADARAFESVDVRFFTSGAFHAKFYVLGRWALVGSANLTGGGLMGNRELSLIVDSEDDLFDEIPALFDELWDTASVLTDDAFERFKRWRLTYASQKLPPIDGISPSSPTTINVRTQQVSRTRTYLETFRLSISKR